MKAQSIQIKPKMLLIFIASSVLLLMLFSLLSVTANAQYFKKLTSNAQIKVIDILGRKVNATITKNYADKKGEISCNSISTGNYFVIISNEKDDENTRLKFNITE